VLCLLFKPVFGLILLGVEATGFVTAVPGLVALEAPQISLSCDLSIEEDLPTFCLTSYLVLLTDLTL
jgi:hypothetical protein